nr:sterile alpha motif domain-containing protein 3-like [Nothobranchius furzeri]
MSREIKMDILATIAQTVFAFKAYPTKQELESVASALIEKHPCLRDPGPGPGHHSWTMSIIYKMGNYRQKLQSAGCSEVLVNRKRSKHDSRPLKKAKRCEVNFLPDNPTGQTDSSLQKEKDELKEEMQKKHPNMAAVKSKMELTFSLRRKEIVSEEPLVDDVLKQWPALFLPDQVCAEFFRITRTNLTSRFFTSLDEYAPKMIKVYRASGAACGEGMKSLLEKLDDQTSDVLSCRKATALRGLPMFMDKHSGSLLKDCLDTEPVEDQINSMKMGILTVIEDDVATVQSSPNIRFFAVVLEEQIVVDEVSDLPTAFALLFGLIYALNMDYPKELKYTFETIQKVFMCLDPKCSARVQSFKNKLLQY